MPMTPFRIIWSALLILAVMAPSVRADDICMDPEEEKNAKAIAAAVRKAEQSGKQAELFVAYWSAAVNECLDRFDKNLQAKAKATLPKLGRDLGKAAEARGVFYSKEPVRADGQTSAFRYYETIGDYTEANRAMVKAVQAKPEDMKLFDTAWDVDQARRVVDPKTGEQKPYVSPASYRQELQKVASANSDKWMKAEEKDAAGLSSGSSGEANMATMSSLEKLRKASEWMKFLPDGDKPARARAEQRGDVVMKRAGPMFTRGSAESYYKFAGTPKAQAAVKQLEKQMEESQHALEKSGEKVKGSITQKSEADQQKFQKGKKDLEKELGF
jgi:hypothetical protein